MGLLRARVAAEAAGRLGTLDLVVLVGKAGGVPAAAAPAIGARGRGRSGYSTAARKAKVPSTRRQLSSVPETLNSPSASVSSRVRRPKTSPCRKNR
jgi:hypothetical protein